MWAVFLLAYAACFSATTVPVPDATCVEISQLNELVTLANLPSMRGEKLEYEVTACARGEESSGAFFVKLLRADGTTISDKAHDKVDSVEGDCVLKVNCTGPGACFVSHKIDTGSSLLNSRTILATIVIVILCKSIFSSMFGPKDTPPVHSSVLPFKNFIDFARNSIGLVQMCNKKLGSVFTIPMFGQRLTFLVGPQGHDVFFNATDKQFDQTEAYAFSVPTFGPGVIYDAPTPVRSQQIKVLRQCLHGRKLEFYADQISAECEQYFGKLEPAGEFDVCDTFAELIILTASRTLLGREIREKLFSEVATLYHDLDRGLTPISVFYPNFPMPAHWNRDRARVKMVDLFSGVINNRRANPDVVEDDMLQALMDAKYKDGTPFNNEEITGMLIAMLFGGQHTSSISSSWTLLFLAHNPKFMERVVEEQRAVIKEHGDDMSLEIVESMEFLGHCVKEAIRMHPPLIFVMRKVLQDAMCGDVRIPAGDIVMLSPAVSGRCEEIFDNPNTYDPERFTEPRLEQEKFKNGYTGFGAGIHRCLGERFALLQIRCIIANIVRNFVITPTSPLPPPDYTALVVPPHKSGCTVHYERRSTPLTG